MPHWRLLFPTRYLCAADLHGRDVDVLVSRVEVEEMTELDRDTKQRRKVKKTIVYFEGKTKGLCLNKTNASTIVELHGKTTEEWVGKAITIFPTTCRAFGKSNVDCIRIREKVPQRKPTPKPQRPARPNDISIEIDRLRAELEAGNVGIEVRAAIDALPDSEAKAELVSAYEQLREPA